MSEQDLSNWIISVDDHVVEPPRVWQDRVPQRYKDAAPRVIEDADGTQIWHYEDKRLNLTALTAVAGIPRSQWSPGPLRYNDVRPGCFDPAARVVDMNADHILMSMCFPSVTRFCGQIFWEGKDHELGLTCVKAYNDWMIEEWCGTVPGRLVPLIIVPLWDPAEAAKEIERCASLGAKGISFCENPSRLGLP